MTFWMSWFWLFCTVFVQNNLNIWMTTKNTAILHNFPYFIWISRICGCQFPFIFFTSDLFSRAWATNINLGIRVQHIWVFIRPFEKRTYYAMAMSVRLSVRPSFPDFFSTCFDISIWNLVYEFSRWHDMSSLTFITIGSLWLSLQ